MEKSTEENCLKWQKSSICLYKIHFMLIRKENIGS
jgi:hypothetical protein